VLGMLQQGNEGNKLGMLKTKRPKWQVKGVGRYGGWQVMGAGRAGELWRQPGRQRATGVVNRVQAQMSQACAGGGWI